MSEQRNLFDPPPVAGGPYPVRPCDPAAEGAESAERCAARAEADGWDRAAAAEFVVQCLREHGPMSGEQLVSAARERFPPHDDRAFGAILGALSRQRRIVKVGSVARAKGHGTAGGILWAVAEGKKPCD